MEDIEMKSRLTDIVSEEDVRALVHAFYDRVRADALLGPVFDEVIGDGWAPHLQIMCDFWSTVLLHTGKYKGDPMSKHLALPIDPNHFRQWLSLFQDTVDELFNGEVAENAKARAKNIARIMQSMMGFKPGDDGRRDSLFR